jgi:hypothetical protein
VFSLYWRCECILQIGWKLILMVLYYGTFLQEIRDIEIGLLGLIRTCPRVWGLRGSLIPSRDDMCFEARDRGEINCYALVLFLVLFKTSNVLCHQSNSPTVPLLNCHTYLPPIFPSPKPKLSRVLNHSEFHYFVSRAKQRGAVLCGTRSPEPQQGLPDPPHGNPALVLLHGK